MTILRRNTPRSIDERIAALKPKPELSPEHQFIDLKNRIYSLLLSKRAAQFFKEQQAKGLDFETIQRLYAQEHRKWKVELEDQAIAETLKKIYPQTGRISSQTEGTYLPSLEAAKIVALRGQEEALSRDVQSAMGRLGQAMSARGIGDSTVAAGGYKDLLLEQMRQRAALRRQALLDIWNLRDLAAQRIQQATLGAAELASLPFRYLGTWGTQLMLGAGGPIMGYGEKMLEGLTEMARGGMFGQPATQPPPPGGLYDTAPTEAIYSAGGPTNTAPTTTTSPAGGAPGQPNVIHQYNLPQIPLGGGVVLVPNTSVAPQNVSSNRIPLGGGWALVPNVQNFSYNLSSLDSYMGLPPYLAR